MGNGRNVLPLALLLSSQLAGAAEQPIETVTIIGSGDAAHRIAGSSDVITAEDLLKFEYTDIQRILAQVPGVYTRDEDGYGLRPNISIRGTFADRSGKITLMEDGVLVSPAPYTASSAYYFPSAGRLAGVEVLKGAAAIENGPYTIGGAINLLSTPIPVSRSGVLTSEFGEDGTYRLHATYGDAGAQWGYLLEGQTHSSDGFSDIDNSSRGTGFRKDDLLAKLRYNTAANARYYQQLELKLQYSEESSDQTYVGLTEADFGDDAYRRYGLSRRDNMSNRHESVALTHVIEFNEMNSLTTTAYYNEFARNWYKVDKIDGEGIDEVVTCANGGNCAGMTSNYGDYDQQHAMRVLAGTASADVYLKNNNRRYASKGIQSVLISEFSLGNIGHSVKVGARYHEDKESRNQPKDRYYQGSDGSFALATVGTASRSEKHSYASSVYVTDLITVGNWGFKPGLRYEDYRINGVDNDELLPGLGLTYDINNAWMLLVGVYEGHSPSAGADSDPETATNYEVGFRHQGANLFVEVVGFFSDYDNIIGVCTNSGGAGNSDCEAGDTENGGKAEVSGIEVQASYTAQFGAVQMPLSVAYTYTDAEFKSSFVGASVWGEVHKGDKLPNLPENQLSVTAGLLFDNGISTDLRLRYYDDTCSTAACNDYQSIDSYYALDLSARYDWNAATRFYVNVNNLTDQNSDIVSREPKAGARGQMPRTVIVGLRYSF